MTACALCRDVGWVLDCDPNREPANVELIACPILDCGRSGRELAILSINAAKFTRYAMHPVLHVLMSVAP